MNTEFQQEAKLRAAEITQAYLDNNPQVTSSLESALIERSEGLGNQLSDRAQALFTLRQALDFILSPEATAPQAESILATSVNCLLASSGEPDLRIEQLKLLELFVSSYDLLIPLPHMNTFKVRLLLLDNIARIQEMTDEIPGNLISHISRIVLKELEMHSEVLAGVEEPVELPQEAFTLVSFIAKNCELLRIRAAGEELLRICGRLRRFLNLMIASGVDSYSSDFESPDLEDFDLGFAFEPSSEANTFDRSGNELSKNLEFADYESDIEDSEFFDPEDIFVDLKVAYVDLFPAIYHCQPERATSEFWVLAMDKDPAETQIAACALSALVELDSSEYEDRFAGLLEDLATFQPFIDPSTSEELNLSSGFETIIDFLTLDPVNFERFKSIFTQMTNPQSAGFKQQFEFAKADCYFSESPKKLAIMKFIEELLANTN